MAGACGSSFAGQCDGDGELPICAIDAQNFSGIIAATPRSWSEPVSESHLDQNVLASLLDVMGDEYPVLLDTFLIDSDERQRHIHEAMVSADAQALRLAAHSFKGSCSNMGVPLLAGLCKQLEEAARRERLDEAPALIEQIGREFAIVRILFKAERQRYR
jgi:HPt (histidine-containing phosphotransfer) domain-containing protein